MKQKISKTQLIDSVYNSVPNVQLKQVDAIVNAFLNEASNKLSQGVALEMRGFGSFEILASKSNIKDIDENTGKANKTYRVKFNAGKKLKENLKKLKMDDIHEDK